MYLKAPRAGCAIEKIGKIVNRCSSDENCRSVDQCQSGASLGAEGPNGSVQDRHTPQTGGLRSTHKGIKGCESANYTTQTILNGRDSPQLRIARTDESRTGAGTTVSGSSLSRYGAAVFAVLVTLGPGWRSIRCSARMRHICRLRSPSCSQPASGGGAPVSRPQPSAQLSNVVLS